jgi:phage shock protein A
MNLFTRLNNIVLATAHQAVDLAEDPKIMIQHVIRKLDAKIRNARATVIAAVTSEKQIAGQLERHRARSEDLAGKAAASVAAGQEALARELLSRKVEHDRLTTELESAWQSARNTSEELKTQLDALIAKRADVHRQQYALAARQRAASARKQICYSLEAADTVADTDNEVGRLRERVSELEAESIAVREVMGTPPRPEAEACDLETAAQVERELEAIRVRLKSNATEKPDTD